MRKNVAVIAMVVSLLFSIQATAEETKIPKERTSKVEGVSQPSINDEIVMVVCETRGEYAVTIMELRQAGVPLSTLLKRVKKGTSNYNAVLLAYEQLRYPTEEYQKQAIENFRNDIELSCFKGG